MDSDQGQWVCWVVAMSVPGGVSVCIGVHQWACQSVGGRVADLAVCECMHHSDTGLGDNLALAFHACKHSGNMAQWGNLREGGREGPLSHSVSL